MMVLAGRGKFDATFDIKDAETIDVAMDIGLDTSLIGSEYSSAEDMCAAMEGEESGVAGEIAPTVEPYEADGMYGRKITGVVDNEEFGNGLDLVEEDGEYHFTLDPAQAGLSDLTDPTLADYGFEFSMTFIFPGEIIESSGGQIDGDTVVFTDASEIANGIDIRAEANSFPWVIVIIAVVVIGFLLLLAAAVAVFFVLRSRKNKAGASSGVPGGYGAGASVGAASGASPAAPPSAQWDQNSPPPAPQGGQGVQSGQGGQQWGQASPPPAPQSGQQWGQGSPPAAPQSDQQWGAPQRGRPRLSAGPAATSVGSSRQRPEPRRAAGARLPAPPQQSGW
ncbi:hypothetical protein [Brachybacterium sp. GPGPB12]|uniref:LppM family (lipo)protein n=1 Tax=Brachybacterium sp. GPGPB12 TaxID=3023517 RepID=UPI0031343BD7